MKQLTVLDLFSGIGGFSLGLERTGGFETIQFVEINTFCQKVLKKHWPEVPCHDDITTYTAPEGFADVICGGFPCQDISTAGKGAGIEGARSGLWKEYARLIGEVRPRFAIVENVSALLGRGLGVVLGDLAALGYYAEWHCIPASAVGAPHRRDRVWILAHRNSNRLMGGESRSKGHQGEAQSQPFISRENVAHTGCNRGRSSKELDRDEAKRGQGILNSTDSGEDVAHPDFCGVEGPRAKFKTAGVGGSGEDVAHAPGFYAQRLHNGQGKGKSWGGSWWAVEPNVGRVAHGVPSRVDRLKSLGNAVVPQIPELLGNAILESL